jgi:thymidylate synthase (FAD)
MNLVKPSVEIITMTPDALRLIELCGRTCYKSEHKITHDSEYIFAKMIIKNGHESVLEHASASVRFICDRGVSHEIVRHRLVSFSQESTRYCDYNKNGHISFIIPPWVSFNEGWSDDKITNQFDGGPEHIWFNAMMDSEAAYCKLRDQGWKPEEARSVLPNSLKTELVMTANFREWRHFFKLRTAKASHPQMQELTIPLLAEFKKRVDIIFDDIHPANRAEVK